MYIKRSELFRICGQSIITPIPFLCQDEEYITANQAHLHCIARKEFLAFLTGDPRVEFFLTRWNDEIGIPVLLPEVQRSLDDIVAAMGLESRGQLWVSKWRPDPRSLGDRLVELLTRVDDSYSALVQRMRDCWNYGMAEVLVWDAAYLAKRLLNLSWHWVAYELRWLFQKQFYAGLPRAITEPIVEYEWSPDMVAALRSGFHVRPGETHEDADKRWKSFVDRAEEISLNKKALPKHDGEVLKRGVHWFYLVRCCGVLQYQILQSVDYDKSVVSTGIRDAEQALGYCR